MTAPVGLGLARVTVAAPRRRIDVALPDNALVAELLPHLLRHAGEELTDPDQEEARWTLRRATGAELEPGRNLQSQGVRDGELLELVPAQVDWPEIGYDDVVEVIASGARRAGRSWGNEATRRCGLAVTAVVLTLGLAGVLLVGSPWGLPGSVALGFALLLAVAGTVLSRAGGDAVAGAVLAGAGMLYALVGGFVVSAPSGVPLNRLGAPHVLLGCTALVVVGVIGMTGVGAVQRVFAAGIGVGVAGAVSALLCYAGMSARGSAAVAVTVAIGLLPGYPLIASWLGRLPIPQLPQRAEQILEDQPMPPRAGVFAAVARASELLSGMLLAAALVGGVGSIALALGGGVSGPLLALAAAGALLLRGRLFPTPSQRIPLLVSGMLALALLATGLTLNAHTAAERIALVIAVLAVAALVLAATLVYSRRPPSPYLGRLADIADVLAIMALVPIACAVIGVYQALQSSFASIG